MKRLTFVLALALAVAMTLPAAAEVEELTAGGSIVIRGNFQEAGFPGSSTGFNDDNPSDAWYSQRTRVNVDAALSGNVRAFIELQSYDFWGGILDSDDAAFSEGGTLSEGGNDLVALYQAYIDMNNIADYPVMLRIGRQELVYGRELLVGNNDAGINHSGLAFDAVKLVYEDEGIRVDAWAAKLLELNSPAGGLLGDVQDDDIDFYGVYGTYSGIENTTIDAYLLLRRMGTDLGTDVDYLYTVGGRAAGIVDIGAGAIDYNAEVAVQFGDTFNGGDYEGLAVDLMAGYNFSDVQYSPRIELAYTYLSGDDDLTDNDNEAFQRLFSDVHYGELDLGATLDAGLPFFGGAASNLHIIRVGGSAVPVEKLTVSADLYYFMLAEDDGGIPVIGGAPVFGATQFGDDDEVGMELDLVADYAYTEDLNLRAGWAHFFADDAIENSWGGTTEDDDVDYLYVQASLIF
jgi:hypothetical protein